MKYFLILITSTLLILLSAVSYGLFAQEANVIYRQGIEYGAEGKFPEAVDWFRENHKNNKSDFTSASSLSVLDDLSGGKITDAYARSFFTGLNFLQNGKMDEGLSELKKTIALNPEYPKAYNVIGMVYASLGDKTKAIDHFQKAIEINPQYAQACFNLAVLYQSLGQTEDALGHYEKVLSLDSNFPEAVMNIAVIYASLGKYSEAIKYYQRAIELDRNNPGLYYNLALAYFMSDQLVKFRDNLLRAQELYQRKNDAQGLEKVAEYMNKIKDIENKFKQAK